MNIPDLGRRILATLARLARCRTVALPLTGLLLCCAVRLATLLVMSLFYRESFDFTICLISVPVLAALGIGFDMGAASFARFLLFAIPVNACCALFAGSFAYLAANPRFGPVPFHNFVLLTEISIPTAAACSVMAWLAMRDTLRKGDKKKPSGH